MNRSCHLVRPGPAAHLHMQAQQCQLRPATRKRQARPPAQICDLFRFGCLRCINLHRIFAPLRSLARVIILQVPNGLFYEGLFRRISIFGAGYVGAVTSACLCKSGNQVVAVDISQAKVESLNRGESPIVETGLDKLFRKALELWPLPRRIVQFCGFRPSLGQAYHPFPGPRPGARGTDALLTASTHVNGMKNYFNCPVQYDSF